ncbi:hypothetical protein [Helicobacter pametensis]|nr:hypothetical protein [Helicobacter pametensis]
MIKNDALQRLNISREEALKKTRKKIRKELEKPEVKAVFLRLKNK